MENQNQNPPAEGYVERTVTYRDVIPRGDVPTGVEISPPKEAPEPPPAAEPVAETEGEGLCPPCKRRHVDDDDRG